MNGRQRIALAVGTALFLLAGLFPPWEEQGFQDQVLGRGAAFLYRAPNPNYSHGSVRIATSRLAVVLLLIAAATGSAVTLLADRRE